jgi:excisionase family DNA binding protein
MLSNMSEEGVSMSNAAIQLKSRSAAELDGNDEDELGVAGMLVEARTSARLTQAELARRMRVSTQTLAQWESGVAAPSLSALKEFAAATGVRLCVSLAPPGADPAESARAKRLHPNPRGAGDPDVMTVDEMAVLLRLNRKTVYELVRQGVIPVQRVGRSLRASRETVLRWLSEGATLRERTRTARRAGRS